MNGKGLTTLQVTALRKRVGAYQDALARKALVPGAGAAALLYLVSLILEAEAGSPAEHELAQRMWQGARDKLRTGLGRAPMVEDIEAQLQVDEPFDAGLAEFLRHDLEAGG